MVDSSPDLRISDVIAHPLFAKFDTPGRTSWGEYPGASIVLVEVRTDAGIAGYGECLGRFGALGYAEAIRSLYRPRLLGQDPFDIARHWASMRRALSGRSGGMAMEAMAGVDIALWDILGKAAGLPLYRLFGGVGRKSVPCYASSVGWGSDTEAKVQVERFLAMGFTSIKIKIGQPVGDAIRRIELVRALAGDAVDLSADANWAYSVADALRVGEALEKCRYIWFEEPIVPEDIEGYRLLRSKLRVPLAAGESDYTAADSQHLLMSRTIDYVQPNITRSGGISETRRIVDLARSCNVSYAPHSGMSGIVCEVASLHVAAAAPNLYALECACSNNPLRTALSSRAPASALLADGAVTVPHAPGLGIDIDWDVVERLRLS